MFHLSYQRRYRRYVSGFEEFLSTDHEESMKILQLAENEIKKTKQITDRRNKLSAEYGKVRLDVYHWEESWRTVKMCQRFLYQVSPLAWRAEHDWIHRTDSGESILHRADDLFGRYRMVDEVASLDVLIGNSYYSTFVCFLYLGKDSMLEDISLMSCIEVLLIISYLYTYLFPFEIYVSFIVAIGVLE